MTTAPAGLRAEVLDQAGQAWGLAGDTARAYAAADAAVALLPNDPDLLIDRAQAAASAGYFDKALDDLDHILKGNPDRVDALIYRASANRALDRLDSALADIEEALAQTPNSVPALLERGNIRRLKGDGAGAPRLGARRPTGPGQLGGPRC
jgi:tetratricopeptide (TPR) repeat protein